MSSTREAAAEADGPTADGTACDDGVPPTPGDADPGGAPVADPPEQATTSTVASPRIAWNLTPARIVCQSPPYSLGGRTGRIVAGPQPIDVTRADPTDA